MHGFCKPESRAQVSNSPPFSLKLPQFINDSKYKGGFKMLQPMYPGFLEFMVIDVILWVTRALVIGFFGGLAWRLGTRLGNLGKKK